ncbi:MAG: hypothetical protein HQK79_00985 [Desulfobacterales bacterium]|nr:hypothetical protein [Desulfobacterales bacterium]
MTNLRMIIQSFMYVFICGVFIVGYTLVMILPRYYSLNKLELQVKQTKADIEEQQILLPLYIEVKKKLDQYVFPANLPIPKTGPLSREDTQKIAEALKAIAKKCNLSLEKISSDVGKEVNPGYLLVNMTMRGDLFFYIRDFLLRLNEESYSNYLEKVQIESIPGFKEFKLKIWIAQA